MKGAINRVSIDRNNKHIRWVTIGLAPMTSPNLAGPLDDPEGAGFFANLAFKHKGFLNK